MNELNINFIVNLALNILNHRTVKSESINKTHFQGADRSNEYSLELSFEYLIDKNKLQWITISSEQAILMSVCLQSMIDELLLKKKGGIKIEVLCMFIVKRSMRKFMCNV